MNNYICDEQVRIGYGDLKLEGVLSYDSSAQATHCALLLSPHPNFAGTMDNNVIISLASQLANIGFVVLRFNYPGIGRSEIDIPETASVFDYWEDVESQQNLEVAVRPAIAASQFLRTVATSDSSTASSNLILVGYSFGAVIALLLAKRLTDVSSVFAIAMPWVSHYNYNQITDVPCHCFFITATQDYVFNEAVFNREWSSMSGPKQLIHLDCDHFFRNAEHILGKTVMKLLDDKYKDKQYEA